MERLTPFGKLIRKLRKQADLTQAGLAGLAGVSPHTVHRAETDSVDRDNAAAIIQALTRQLDLTNSIQKELAIAYVLPKLAAQAETYRNIVAVIVPHTHLSAFWSMIAVRIEAHAFAAGYLTTLCQHRDNVRYELDYLEVLEHSGNLAGILLAPACGTTNTEHALRRDTMSRRLITFREHDTPIVLFDRISPGYDHLPYVGIDNEYAACIAVEHLIAKQHKNIGGMFYFRHLSNQQERFQGYKETLYAAGLKYEPDWVTFQPEERRISPVPDTKWLADYRGRDQARKLLRLVQDGSITAIFCATYFGALTLLNVASEMNASGEAKIVVPDDVSIIAFDNASELDDASPPIARVYYDLDELAKRSVDMMLFLKANPGTKTGVLGKGLNDIVGQDYIKIMEGRSVKYPR